MVPAGTPPRVIARLQADVTAAASQPEVQQKLRGAGIDAQASGAEPLRAFMAAEQLKWTTHIRAAGITPE